MAKFLQPSLSGGELAYGMRGRVDLARFAISLGKARNFNTKVSGGGAKRTGSWFRGRVKHSDRFTRLIPFVYSTGVRYMLEAGDGYFRFWTGGALVTNGTKAITGISNASPGVVTAVGHGWANGDHVVIGGVRGLSRVNARSFRIIGVTTDTFQLEGFDTTADAAYISGGTASRIVEVVTPYSSALLRAVRFTQSADVMYMVHPDVPPKELRRLTVNSFELRDFAFKRGPFRPFNNNEAHVMAVSGVTGNVTVTTNVDVFTPEMVGSLLYVEEKELQGVKPWASAEKNCGLGAMRRSDSKVFKCVGIPSLAGLSSSDMANNPPYYVCGGTRPVHDVGRAYDGPQDIKFDGVAQYKVGVNWEFLHNTFGIMRITEYVDAQEVKAVVVERVPDSIVGVAPSPTNTWLLDGDGTTVTFPIAGAGSDSELDYRVTINGQPIQSNPFYSGGGGVNGGGGGSVRPGNTDFPQQLE